MVESIFCTNCGGEFYLSEIRFTICGGTNHLMGTCPLCNWNEFSVDDDIDIDKIEAHSNYPKPEFYVEAK